MAREMTAEQALNEAKRRWGAGGRARERPVSLYKGREMPGRLARYRFIVGDGALGIACTVIGQGHTWAEAFEDVRPRPRQAGRQAY